MQIGLLTSGWASRYFVAAAIFLIVQTAHAYPRMNIRHGDDPNKLKKAEFNCPAEKTKIDKSLSKAHYKIKKEEFSSRMNLKKIDFLVNNAPGEDIIIDSDITANQIWTANNSYTVTDSINIQALLVIEPGTSIFFYYGCGLYVNNGGTIISNGAPDNPIIYSSVYEQQDFGDYSCAICIEETASPASSVTYSYIEYAENGIITKNIRLDRPIENNYLFLNSTGIKEYGTRHTNIMNNLVFYTYDRGINVYMASENGIGDANSNILIENNTCDYYQDYGITVHGVADHNDIGLVMVVNNIVSGSYGAGLNLVDGFMTGLVYNTGYYGNMNNKNWEFPEENPVEAMDSPYNRIPIPGGACYLMQDCPFIDAGAGYIEETQLIGKTTDANSIPDSNTVDLGFHYMDWNYVNAGQSALEADFDNSLCVETNDLDTFADFWLFDYDDAYEVWWWDYDYSGRVDMEDLDYLIDYWPEYFDLFDFAQFANCWQREVDDRLWDERPNLIKDDIIDFKDFSVLADQWLETTENPYSLEVTLDQEPNLVSNVLSLTLENTSEDVTTYLFIDGQNLGRFFGEDISIPTYEYRNGPHEIKLVGVTIDNDILLSPKINVEFNNKLHCLTGRETYKYNQAYGFAGFYEPNNGSTIDLSIKDLNDSIIWTSSASGGFNFTVPAGVLQSPYNDLTVSEVGGDWEDWIKDIVKEFDVTSDPSCKNAKSLLVGVKKGFSILGIGIGDWTYNRKEVWKEYLNSCKKRGLDPTICLFFGQATGVNIQTAYRIPSVEAIYIISDGNRRVGDPDKNPNCPWRTFFDAWDGKFFSRLKRNWIGDPNEYIDLGHYESSYSVADSIYWFMAKEHLHVFHDCCMNGPMCMNESFYTETMLVPPPSDNHFNLDDYNRTRDMAVSYGITPTSSKRNFMGWRGEAFKGNPLRHYNTFIKALWTELGNWDTYKVAFGDAALADEGCVTPAQNFSHVGDLTDRFIP